ncbi:hypothetical protein DMENIID0001_019450 [Sergentomyia squamirostris]
MNKLGLLIPFLLCSVAFAAHVELQKCHHFSGKHNLPLWVDISCCDGHVCNIVAGEPITITIAINPQLTCDGVNVELYIDAGLLLNIPVPAMDACPYCVTGCPINSSLDEVVFEITVPLPLDIKIPAIECNIEVLFTDVKTGKSLSCTGIDLQFGGGKKGIFGLY